MTRIVAIHAENPQRRLISQVVAVLRAGGVIAYPTDSCYALGCALGNKPAADRIRVIRKLTADHEFSLICRDLSELASYARVDNSAYRLLKALTPGGYTFLLRATREVPRRLQDPRRRTVGLRVTANVIARRLVEDLGEPIMSSTLQLPGDDIPLTDAEEIRERLAGRVEMIIDGGAGGLEPTTVVDLTDEPPRVVRQGVGDSSMFDS